MSQYDVARVHVRRQMAVNHAKFAACPSASNFLALEDSMLAWQRLRDADLHHINRLSFLDTVPFDQFSHVLAEEPRAWAKVQECVKHNIRIGNKLAEMVDAVPRTWTPPVSEAIHALSVKLLSGRFV